MLLPYSEADVARRPSSGIDTGSSSAGQILPTKTSDWGEGFRLECLLSIDSFFLYGMICVFFSLSARRRHLDPAVSHSR